MRVLQKKRSAAFSNGRPAPEALKRRESSSGGSGRLPSGIELQKLLALKFGAAAEDYLEPTLFSLISDLIIRPSKQVRGRLVSVGYRLTRRDRPVTRASERRCNLGAQVVEFLHAGSLIVDDIEDGSKARRGGAALHLQYGLPLALNAGNWLYFWPSEIVREMALHETQELLLYRYYHQTLLRAHFGQALDLGVRIDSIEQHRVAGIVLSSMELKTGALVAFALVMGGILAGASESSLRILDEFGHGLGVGLQMFDDLGNLAGRVEPAKRFEDLLLRRPSWVWACAAQGCSEKNYQEFVSAVQRLPDVESVENWLRRHDLLNQGKGQAVGHFARILMKLRLALGKAVEPEISGEISKMVRELENAYG